MVPQTTLSDVETVVTAARNAFDSGVWSDLPAGQRADALLRIAANVAARKAKRCITYSTRWFLSLYVAVNNDKFNAKLDYAIF